MLKRRSKKSENISCFKALSSSLNQFMLPRHIQGDTVSIILSRSFKWTFIVTFVLSSVIYLFLTPNHDLVTANLSVVGKGTALISGRSHDDSVVGDVNALFFLISVAIAWTLFEINLKKIPENAYSSGRKLVFTSISLLLFPLAFIALQKISEAFGSYSGNIWIGGAWVVCFSYIYAFLSSHFVRFLLVFSAIAGWRKTSQ